MKKELTKTEIIERSIIKKYRKEIWTRFTKAVTDYELINENDNIMVCISGGKDSFLLAKCIQEIKKHGKIHFNARFVVMNPGYKEENLNKIINNAKILNIPIEIFNTDIFNVVDSISEESPCYLCARMRRGYLYDYATKIGCNKIALGHHFNDVIETTLLSMFYGAEVKTMLPKLHSTNFKDIDLIRPLYLVKEDDIISWAKYNDLFFLNCACKFTDKHYNINDGTSKRKEIKELIRELKKINPNIDNNIFTSMSNINIDAVLGYHTKEDNHSFMDDF